MGMIVQAQLLLIAVVAAACSPAPVSTTATTTADSIEVEDQAQPASGSAVCGRLPSEPEEPMEYFGEDSDECDRITTTWGNVPHADRVCADSADCTVIYGQGHCGHLRLNRDAATRPEYQAPPCRDPAAGACPQQEVPSECIQGCCGGPRS